MELQLLLNSFGRIIAGSKITASLFALTDALVTTKGEAAKAAIAQANASQVFGAFAADNKELIEIISQRVNVESDLGKSLVGITTGTKD